MTDWLDALRAGAHEFALTLTAEQEARFTRLLALLEQRNRTMNLTAITDPVEVARKHFVDSLSVETVWQPGPAERGIDIGTGAGFPGLPLAIRYPHLPLVLNDGTRKKVEFLREAAEVLTLRAVQPVWARAEELGRNPGYRGGFSVVFARAVAHLAELAEYALPLLRPGGRLIAMKGPSGAEEIAASARALALLGGEVAEVRALQIPEVGARLLIVIRALHPAPADYPRAPGAAKKHPLY